MSAAAPPLTSVIVTLRQQADVRDLTGGSRRDRIRIVVEALRSTADQTQPGLLELLRTAEARGDVARFTPLWIVNGIAVTATPAFLQSISTRPEVLRITPDESVFAPAAASAAPAEPNVSLVNAPALWSLGYRGQGVVIASMDTGVDSTHPDLRTRWRGGTNSWYDPNGQHPNTPTDVSGHGTQTMGVIVGGSAGGTAIGIAPGAKWIAVKIFNDRGVATTSGIHLGYQWLLDPDGDPSTPDAPNVVNNSWDFANPGCDLAFQQDLQNLRAAGILPVFAAGNSGPSPSTSVSPANYPEALSVGATDDGEAIFAGSSRGPSACREPDAIFPDLVAPGVDIRSSDLFGRYVSSTGTSLAAPHVTGAAALLLSAFPNASPELQISALEESAVDLGASGPDNTYGNGRIDALAAFRWLDSQPDFSVTASPNSAVTNPGGSVTYNVSVVPRNGFDTGVSLSLSGLTAAQGSWKFTPGTVRGGSGSSQLSITASASLAPGTYPLTITGRGGGLTRTASSLLVVTDFGLSATPGSVSTTPGGTASYTVSATAANFSGDVKLSLSGLTPSQASWTFTPATIAGGTGTSQLDIRTTASLGQGRYPLTITGTGAGLTRTATVQLLVASAPDFALTASPPLIRTSLGGAATYTVSATRSNGFNYDVGLSLSGLAPSQASWTFTGASVAGGSGSSQLKITANTSLAAGSYPLTIVGKGGGLTRTASVMLVVSTAADFSVDVAPASRTVSIGGAAGYTVTITAKNGFTGSVSFAVGGLPSGAAASFSPQTLASSGTSTMTVRAGSARGTFVLTIRASSGARLHTATASVTVA